MSGYRKRIKHFHEPGYLHELTFSCYRRMPLLTNDVWRTVLAESITRATERHLYRLVAFVFMPEHVHLLVYPDQEASRLPELLTAIKRPCSWQIKQLLQQSGSRLLERLTVPFLFATCVPLCGPMAVMSVFEKGPPRGGGGFSSPTLLFSHPHE